MAIDSHLNLATLKTFKTVAWLFSSIGFWLSAYLIENKMIVKGDIWCKIILMIFMMLSFFQPVAIYGILLLNGLINPFNTMSNFAMIQLDEDDISVAQKELVMNLFGYFSGMLSSYLLLNIHRNLALALIILTLMVSVTKENRLYKAKQKGGNSIWTI